jgi:hypothetical protein
MCGQLCLGNFPEDHRRYGNEVDKPVGRLEKPFLHEIDSSQTPTHKDNDKDRKDCFENVGHKTFLGTRCTAQGAW